MKIHVDRKPFGKAAFTPYPFVYVVWKGVGDWHPDDRACLMVHERAHTTQYLAFSVVALVAWVVLAAVGEVSGLIAAGGYVLTAPVPFWIAYAIPQTRDKIEGWAHDRHVRCLKRRGRT